MRRACSVLLAGIAAAVAAGACRSEEDRSTHAAVPRQSALRPGIVARVGDVEISADSVVRIASSQGIPLVKARDLAIRDALFASEARARGLDRGPARFAVRGALARFVLRDILARARQAGPVTDDELREATERRWLDLDRPPGARTVHAVIRLDDKADSERRARALDVAERMRRAVLPVAARAITDLARQVSSDPLVEGAPDPLVEPFSQAVRSVPHDGFELVVEPLPPVAVDGRVLEPGGREFDLDFARAAASLGERGAVSAPVVSKFGVHIIVLLERLPAKMVAPEERRALVLDDVVASRARAAKRLLLESLFEGGAIDRGVDAQLALVPVGQ